MHVNLTPKQLETARLIRDSIATRGHSPTLEELSKQCGISKVAMFDRIEGLVVRGVLARSEPYRSRNLTVLIELPGDPVRKAIEALREAVRVESWDAVRSVLAGLDSTGGASPK